MKKNLLIHYAEIGLKGKNRSFFERQLRNDLFRRLHPDQASQIRMERGRLTGELTETFQEERIHGIFQQVFGVAWYAIAQVLPKDYEEIEKVCLKEAKKNPEGTTFKVFTRRVDKTFPISSQEMCRRLGQTLVERAKLKVDLEKYQRALYVDIFPDKACVYTKKHPGLRGMPKASSGRLLCLFSGGIDSPVAAWLLMRRGAVLHFLHFHPFRQGEEVLESKITELHSVLQNYNSKAKLYLIPHFLFQTEAALKIPPAYETVFFRRFMFRAAQELAQRMKMQAIVTGDSLGQVASQTLENLTAAQSDLAIPILQPLIAYDKQDVINLAEKIETFDLSNKAYKDCCSLMSRRPKTNVSVKEIQELEKTFDLKKMIDQSLDLLEVWDGKKLKPIKMTPPHIERTLQKT